MIDSVVSMVPNYQVMLNGEIVVPDNQFSYMAAPFSQLATLCGEIDDGNDDEGINSK
jgi:hypothetical protein